jgi:hypothetical protein
LGPATSTWNGVAWEYVSSYTIPPANADTSDSGDRYRLLVATTSSNLSNTNCQFTDEAKIIDLTVNDCGDPLKTGLLALRGRLINGYAHLSWTTSRESEPLRFDIERSNDGINFTPVGSVNSRKNYNSETNDYSFFDSTYVTRKVSYRVVIINDGGHKEFSHVVQLNMDQTGLTLGNILNPFSNALSFDVNTDNNGIIEITLSDITGRSVRKRNFFAYTGVNNMRIENTEGLSPGMYILQVKDKERMISKQVIKK